MLLHRLSARQLRILEVLRVNPFLSCEQLQMLLGWRIRTLQVYLTQLHQWNLICLIHSRHPNIPARALWVLKLEGLRALADHANLPLFVYLTKYHYSRARLEWLTLRLERVYHIRTFLLRLHRMRWAWSVDTLDVEVEAQFDADHGTYYPARLPGIARLKNPQGRWVTLAIEYDLNAMPIKGERARLERFVRSITLPGFNEPSQYLFPIWVILAATKERLQDYHSLLTSFIPASGLLPWTFLTTREQLATFYRDASAAIWETELARFPETVPLLNRIIGADTRTELIDWQPLPLVQGVNEKQLELKPFPTSAALTHRRHDLAAVTLALYALDKQVLGWIADHPLLDAAELAFIAQLPARSIRRSIKRLRGWGLIQVYSYRRVSRSRCGVLSDKGIWLLTTWAGLGTAVKTYAHLRGWDQGFSGVIKHWDHTRLENQIYLQFLREARQRGHELISWQSELEAQLYSEMQKLGPDYRRRPSEREAERAEVSGDSIPTLAEYGQNMSRFLPDGSGVYRVGSISHYIAVEVDRSKANMRKMRDKVRYYSSTLALRDTVTWRILIVTTGWRRALHLADLVLQNALDVPPYSTVGNLRGEKLIAALKQIEEFELWQELILPVFITTIDALNEHGIAGKIWINPWNAIYQQTDSMEYCLECFQPKE